MSYEFIQECERVYLDMHACFLMGNMVVYCGSSMLLMSNITADVCLCCRCMQRAKYDIGEEAISRFALPPEDKATLELTEWVDGSFRKASVRS